ncbi:Phospholipase D/Transphosphatidylase [Labilithrix luteola]|uniref:Phospholipase D/Transphosphatidylase n=1 Tax=Labilithrix luteola TaxID=1391654 RepID=A0A0K1QC98_9BACT|nr:Phospholipase D/Transphosphatidylase [Labilithrix luteola]
MSSGLLVDAHDYYVAFYEAAQRARRSVLLLGWQFDSDVELVRGEDLPPGANGRDFRLLRTLDRLCRERPDLEVRILAWDHSVVFALEREILQKVVFDVVTCDRFHFKYDATVPSPGSHHQKVAIVDGRVAFTGSADLCQSRWDASTHLAHDPRRSARGELYAPYHEVQMLLPGAPAESLVELFVERWAHATGEALDAEALIDRRAGGLDPRHVPTTLRMPRTKVALSRTVPVGGGPEPSREIRDLYVSAIREAERLVYIETQYLTSAAVRDALVARLRDATRPALDVIIVLPRRPSSLKEELTIGPAQAEVIDALRAVAREAGQGLGVYNVAAAESSERSEADEDDVFVYIHSKLMIVDDRFFTVGSANLTNRSMTIDSEVNVSLFADDGDGEVRGAIERARKRLMSEHLGELVEQHLLGSPEGLVARIDRAIARGLVKFRHHGTTGEPPSALAKVVKELAGDYLDPEDASRRQVATIERRRSSADEPSSTS